VSRADECHPSPFNPFTRTDARAGIFVTLFIFERRARQQDTENNQ